MPLMASNRNISADKYCGINYAIGYRGLWLARLAQFGILSVLVAQLSAQVTVEMSQYNYERTGANLQEWILHPSNVNSSQFGKVFSRNVDASVYALPLIVPNLNIAGKRRNVLFVATMGNTIYAFDADDPARVQPYWSKNLGTPAPGDSWIGPIYHGILSTPFIDVPTGTLYTVTMVRKDKVQPLCACVGHTRRHPEVQLTTAPVVSICRGENSHECQRCTAASGAVDEG